MLLNFKILCLKLNEQIVIAISVFRFHNKTTFTKNKILFWFSNPLTKEIQDLPLSLNVLKASELSVILIPVPVKSQHKISWQFSQCFALCISWRVKTNPSAAVGPNTPKIPIRVIALWKLTLRVVVCLTKRLRGVLIRHIQKIMLAYCVRCKDRVNVGS